MDWSARMSTPSSEHTATPLACCPDCRAVAAALARPLCGHGADILDADQQTLGFS